ISRTVPSPSGQSTLMHSSSSGARSRMEWRGPLPRWGDVLCSIRLVLRTQALQRRRLRGGVLCRRFFRAAEKIDTQETALEGSAKRRPVALALVGGKCGADRGHFGIQIVEKMQHQRLGEHGKFWRTKRILSMMA